MARVCVICGVSLEGTRKQKYCKQHAFQAYYDQTVKYKKKNYNRLYEQYKSVRKENKEKNNER